MAFFKFIGDPRKRGDGPSEMFMYETLFRKGEVSEVHHNIFVEKLRNNRHFLEVKPAKGDGERPMTAKVDAEGPPAMDWTKEQLLGYAKERFGSALEARDTKAVLLEEIMKLTDEDAYRKAN